MKKGKIIMTICMIILSLVFKGNNPITAEEDYDIELPDSLDISEATSTFEVTLKSELKEGETLKISWPKDSYLISGDKKVSLNVTSDKTVFRNKGDIIVFTVEHEELTSGIWKSDFEITFTPIVQTAKKTEEETTAAEETVSEAVTSETVSSSPSVQEDTISYEYKTMYGLKTVNEWDTSSYSLDIPEGPYAAYTQYATETAEFSDSSYSLSVPEDGIYEEKTQYGYESRSKKENKEPYDSIQSYRYNNVGGCPADCVPGSENDYGTGCECTIQNVVTEYRTSTTYGKWKTEESSFRFNDPYSKSDTINPISRTVYLTPVSFHSNEDWSYEEKSPTSKSRVITRTVYCSPLSYNEASGYSENKPEAGSDSVVVTKKFCRIIRNGNKEAWKECE